jgi:hypothetical protein
LKSTTVCLDDPRLIDTSAVGIEKQLAAIRRPEGMAVPVAISCKLPEILSIDTHHKDIFLRKAGMESYPLAIW